MRISDWSSDVCSSDLGWHGLLSPRCSLPTEKAGVKAPAFFAGPVYRAIPTSDCCGHARGKGFTSAPQPGTTHHPLLHIIALGGKSCCNAAKQEAKRSEEHTSELQSLMRISYAVFCLKKKKNRSTLN